ncbi:MAG: trypsin-like peptidase domain-containing protein [Treponemataceae bacterium]
MKTNLKNTIYTFVLLLVVALAFGTGFFVSKSFSDISKQEQTITRISETGETNSTYITQPIQVADTKYTQDEMQNIRVYENANEAVVNISTQVLGMSFFFEPVPMDGGTGSGAIVDPSGYVLTNTHVIEDAVKIYISLYNGDQYEAKVVGKDMENDLAVLKFEPPKNIVLKTIPFGTSANLKVGQKVLAIGNPFGLDRTLTVGIVSALGRPIRNDNNIIINNMIQTDTAINPGNSGGPLLDSNGFLVGVNTMIYSTSGSSAGVGFAVPVDTARRVLPELIKYGRVARGTIDAQLVQMNSAIANAGNYPVNYGLLVSAVENGSNAKKAGLQGGTRPVRYGYGRNSAILNLGGDIIIAINGQAIKQLSDYYSVLEDKKPNDEVSLTVLRGRKEITLNIKLVARE